MANKGLSGLTGTKENHLQGSANSVRPGDSAVKDGFGARYDGPNDHVGLLEYFYGHPTSTSKSHGRPGNSRW